MIVPKVEDPWNIQSLYDLQYFNCPVCPDYKNQSKQEFFDHAYNLHPESEEALKNIVDESIGDIVTPWINDFDLKNNENMNNYEEYIQGDNQIEYDDDNDVDIKQEPILTTSQNSQSESFLFSASTKKTLYEKRQLGKLVAKFKAEYDNCPTVFDAKHNKWVQKKPKGGFISKAVRAFYKDLNNAKSDDKKFLRAVRLAERGHKSFLQFPFLTEQESKQRFRAKGGGRKSSLYVCGSCDKQFTIAKLLRKHVKTSHEGMDEDDTNADVGKPWLPNLDLKNDENISHYEEEYVVEVDNIKQEPNFEDQNIDTKIDNLDSVNLPDHETYIEKFEEEENPLIEQDFTCESCFPHVMFLSKKELTEHKKSVHNLNEENLTCDSCIPNLTFLSRKELKEHKKSVHNMIVRGRGRPKSLPEDCKCNHCGKTFTQVARMKRHIKRTHEGIRGQKCDICGKDYSDTGSLKNHFITVHEGKRNHICPQCGKAFFVKYLLMRHIRRVHTDCRSHKCDTCGKIFLRAEGLKKHILTVHEGVKLHICYLCGSSFTTSAYLKTHIYNIHEGYRDHKCDLCGKMFTQKGNVKKHIQEFHEKRRDHQCASCGKSFVDKQSLTRHTKSYHENVFKCQDCDKTFLKEDNLKKHILVIHLGHKDIHWCEPCGLSFSQTSNLTRHIETVHDGIRKFKCELCGVFKKQKVELKKHKCIPQDEKLQQPNSS